MDRFPRLMTHMPSVPSHQQVIPFHEHRLLLMLQLVRHGAVAPHSPALLASSTAAAHMGDPGRDRGRGREGGINHRKDSVDRLDSKVGKMDSMWLTRAAWNLQQVQRHSGWEAKVWLKGAEVTCTSAGRPCRGGMRAYGRGNNSPRDGLQPSRVPLPGQAAAARLEGYGQAEKLRPSWATTARSQCVDPSGTSQVQQVGHGPRRGEGSQGSELQGHQRHQETLVWASGGCGRKTMMESQRA